MAEAATLEKAPTEARQQRIKAEVTRAQNFFKQPTEKAEVNGDPADLFKKFRTKQENDQRVSRGEEPIKEEEVKPSEQANPDTEVKPVEENTDTKPTEKKPGYINSLKSTNEELSRKVDTYEKEKLPELNKTIDDLKKQIEAGGTKKEIDDLKVDLQKVRDEKQQREESLVKEVGELRKQNAFYNLPGDKDFQAKYTQPQQQAFNNVASILGNDNSLMVELDKALNAHIASITSVDPVEQGRQREISTQTLNSIYESLSPIQQAQFQTRSWDLLAKVGDRIAALTNWEQTKAQIETDRNSRNSETKIKTTQRWREAAETAKRKVDEEVKYSEDIARIIKANNINDDDSGDTSIAEAAIQDTPHNYAPEEIARVLQQGAKFPKLKAAIAARDAQIKELEETIKKMRGSSTSESTISSSSSGKGAPEEKTPASLFAKFREKQNQQR